MTGVSARTTPLPTLQDLAALFDVLPEMPIPPPRRRNPQTLGPGSAVQPGPDSQPVSNAAQSTISTPPNPASFIWRLLQWVFPSKRDDLTSTSKNTIVKPNPFVILKNGKKFAVVAAVDMGNISFFKFGQGDFSEYPIL
jgi:tRNA-splicing endonuclease subunit Sen54